MDRKQELEEIIDIAGRELSKIRSAELALRDADYAIQEAHYQGVSEEDLLGIVDAVYHPSGDLTDED